LEPANEPRSSQDCLEVRPQDCSPKVWLQTQSFQAVRDLKIQVQDAFKAEADAAIEVLKEAFRKENISYSSMERNDPNSIATAETIQINIRGVSAGQTNEFRRLTSDRVGQQWLLMPETSSDYRLNLRREAAVKLRQDTLTQSIRTMERKVNGLGVAEAAVQQRGGSGGETEIMVQLPGVDDPGRVKAILQTSAMLELCEVKGGPFPSREAVLGEYGGIQPLNSKIVRGSSRAGGTENWWLLARSPVITGRDLRDARAQQGEIPGRWETGFTLTGEAAGRFERFTSANIGNPLAIVLDNTVISAPTIQAAISDQGQITGASSIEEASDLALNLRAGSLPAGVQVIEERTVGPSLGADSIRRGITAGIVGLALVVASMLLYYRGAGWNAVLSLLLNTIITIAALSYIDATHVTTVVASAFLFYLRYRSGPRVRGDVGDRIGCQFVYGRVCVAGDIRCSDLAQSARGAPQYRTRIVRRNEDRFSVQAYADTRHVGSRDCH
jgi:preprotein translocase subunit SecD